MQSFSAFGRQARYASRSNDLGTPLDLSAVETDMNSIVAYRMSRGVEAGSEDALLIDF